MIAIVRHDLGRRVYLRDHRVHHGLVGATLFAVGACVMWSDRRDFPWSARRELK